MADCSGAEACSWAVADGGVEGGADDADVERRVRSGQAFDVWEVGEGGDACECPLRLCQKG